MIKRYPGWNWSSIFARTFATGGAITLTGCLAIAFSGSRALAQVTADTPPISLGTKVDGNDGNWVITGGTPVGKNLFHSFKIFNLNNPTDVATFKSQGFTNILSRVTGGSSTINGTIRSSSTANIFLINPAGIIFGPNAQLQIGGSFVGTTANAIWFLGGGMFSQTSPVASDNPMLAVNPNALFFNQTPAGAIRVNQSTLQVKRTQNLFLVGGDVILQDSTLKAPGGRVELGGLAQTGEVEIKDITRDGRNSVLLNFPKVGLHFLDGVARANVSLTNATIDVDSRTSGDIYITAGDQLSLVNSEVSSRSQNSLSSGYSVIQLSAQGSVSLSGSMLSTSNFGDGGYSGDIAISAPGQVSIINGSSIFSQGNLGNIFIGGDIGNPDYGLLTPRSVMIDNATLKTTGLNSGIAGNIIINAHDQIAINNSEVASQSANDRTDDFGFIKLAATEGSVLLNQSTISTTNSSSGFAGDISISARDEVSILNQSNVLSNGYFGRILIGKSNVYDSSFSPRTVRIDNSTVRAESTVKAAGDINIDATDSISISNIPLAQDGSSRFSTNARGDKVVAGDISLQAGNSVSIANSIITSELDPGIMGYAGSIEIEASSISLTNNTELRTLIFGHGTAGNITLQTNGGSVSMDNSRIFSTVESTGNGLGGSIEIDTGSLSVSNRSELQTLVRRDGGVGDAGLIWIKADGEVSLTNRGRIFSTVESGAIGNAGVILMEVGSLSIDGDGAVDNASFVNTSVLGVGNPGYILVQADKDVSLRGNGSGIYSASGSGSTNLGDRTGAIFIDARSLFIRDGARVSVENQGSGEAGSIFVTAREDIIMRDQGQIRAIANSGLGGNIFLNSGDFLVLVNGSQVSTQVGAGDGGKVDVDTRYIIAAPFKNNNIDAFADSGTGGAIDIRANRLYDISERVDVPVSNDIDPTARSGVNGTLTATVLNLDPTQGLSNLPTDFIDPTRLIAETCAPRGGITERQKNQFIVTNRGGLPPDPNAAFPGEAVVTDQGTPNQQNNQPNSPHSTNPASSPPVATASPQPPENQPDNPGSSNSTSATPTATASPQPPENQPDNPSSSNSVSATPTATASPQQPIVEAQGWVYEKNGDIKFTNESPIGTPTHSQLIPASTCNGLSTQP